MATRHLLASSPLTALLVSGKPAAHFLGRRQEQPFYKDETILFILGWLPLLSLLSFFFF